MTRRKIFQITRSYSAKFETNFAWLWALFFKWFSALGMESETEEYVSGEYRFRTTEPIGTFTEIAKFEFNKYVNLPWVFMGFIWICSKFIPEFCIKNCKTGKFIINDTIKIEFKKDGECIIFRYKYPMAVSYFFITWLFAKTSSEDFFILLEQKRPRNMRCHMLED